MISIVKSNDLNNEFYNKILNRNQFEFEEVNQVVDDILKDVRTRKDEALRYYTRKFDNVEIDDFLVKEEEIEEAFKKVPRELIEALVKAKENIEKFHKKQIRSSYFLTEGEDIILSQLIKPIEKVGVYVPGGSASYPSTVLMNVIPAKIAGVKELVMITPPDKSGKVKDNILAAAKIAGVDKIYKVGGAQGVAALAFGTESIGKVNKIVGPGNIYVAIAKAKVSGYVGIDSIAGPSEILIIADESANYKFIAADLISQAEHDEMASAILLTDSPSLGMKVKEEIERQVKKLYREGIIRKALCNFGAIIITNSLSESVYIANEIAPEHLEIHTKDPFLVYKSIKNAGAIFLGEYSPEALGDYFAGTNHTLPTSATARYSSPLSVDDFIKKTSLIYYSKEALYRSKEYIMTIADSEGLTGHKNSIAIRF